MQNRDSFVAERTPSWKELNHLLSLGPLNKLRPPEISRTAALYRAVCSDLMRARSLGCGSDVIAHLDSLAARGHNALYGPRPYSLSAVRELVTSEFPRVVRANLRFFVLASVLFYGPLAFGWVNALTSTNFATSVMPPEALRESVEMYRTDLDRGDVGADSAMAGFYVHNNVGIAFRCFATGIVFGLGSVFFLVYNGLVIGTTAGWLSHEGVGTNLFTFGSGHAAFELTAIVIAGMAGLKMGYALVRTEGRTRFGNLRAQGGDLVKLIIGAAMLLFVAAGIEGFWSASRAPARVKWTVGAVNALIVGAYLGLAGRSGRRHIESR